MDSMVAAYRYEQNADGKLVCVTRFGQRMTGFVVDLPSPSDMLGQGASFEESLKDYITRLDEYIETLHQFRTDLMEAEDKTAMAVRVDENSVMLLPGREGGQ